MLEIQIKTNGAQLERKLSEFVKKQIPFAMAKTLTQIAKAAQEELRKELPNHFTIRNHYVSNGITIQKADKKDWPNLQAVVGSRSWFMQLQEEGGEKHLSTLSFVPVPIRKRVRPNEAEMIQKGMRPQRLLQLVHSKKNYRIEKLRSTGAQAIVYRPQAKTYKRRAPQGSVLAMQRKQQRGDAMKQVQVLWVLPESTHLKKKWNFYETVKRVTANLYDKTFGKNLAEAIRTARR